MRKLIFLITLLSTWQTIAASLQINVTDAAQQPLPYTIIELVNPNYPAIAQTEAAQVIQKDLNFQPFVSFVQQGTLVEFPNLDKTRHHVYSFSKAKAFELRLYAGKPEAPVLFDKPGVVTLGCNIHDNMLAYIYISASRFVAMTDAKGEVGFDDLPEANFKITLWQPWQKKALLPYDVSIQKGEQQKHIALDITQRTVPATQKSSFNDY